MCPGSNCQLTVNMTVTRAAEKMCKRHDASVPVESFESGRLTCSVELNDICLYKLKESLHACVGYCILSVFTVRLPSVPGKIFVKTICDSGSKSTCNDSYNYYFDWQIQFCGINLRFL